MVDNCLLGLGGLHVIDLQSGDLLQTVRFEMEGDVSAIIVDGDEIYIAGFDNNAGLTGLNAGQVVVLQLAGSEAYLRAGDALHRGTKSRGRAATPEILWDRTWAVAR